MLRRATSDLTLDNLWIRALFQLNDDDKGRIDVKQFDEGHPVDKLLQSIDKYQDDQVKSRREIRRKSGKPLILRDLYAKIVTCINKFKAIGDIVVQYDPAHAALPWAAVRFVLQAAVSEQELYTSMLEGLEYVSEVITRSAWMETLYLSASSILRKPLQAELVKLYVVVLQFLGKARRHYSKSKVHRALGSLFSFDEQSVAGYMSHISDSEAKVKRIAELIDARFLRELSRSIEDGFEKISEQNENISQQIADLRGDPDHGKSQGIVDAPRDDVLKWVDATSSQADFLAAQHARLSDTCEWILQREELKEWLDVGQSRKTPKVLWIHGRPGAGKTIISAKLADHLQNTSSSPFAYFFCFYGNELKRSCLKIVRSWVSQLAKENGKALHVVSEFYREKESERATEFELWQTFRQLNATIDLCSFLVDGFDECDNDEVDYRTHTSLDSRATFLSRLNDSLRGTSARVLIMSRPDFDLREQLQSNSVLTPDSRVLWKACDISPKDTSRDVRAFAQRVMDQRLRKKSTKLRNELADRATEKAQGMFLWIKLLQNRLSGSKTSSELRRIIEDTPSGLEQAYERDLLRIANLEPGDRNRAIAILRWTIYAKRPLTVRQLAEALLVDLEEETSTIHGQHSDLEHVSDSDDSERDSDGDCHFPRKYLSRNFDEDYVQHEFFRLFGSLIELRGGEGTILEGEDDESYDKYSDETDEDSDETSHDMDETGYESDEKDDGSDGTDDEDKVEDTYGEHTIHFIHFSVQEYLLKVDYTTIQPLQACRLAESRYSRERLTQVCLKYLCYRDFRQEKNSTLEQFEEKIRKYAFLQYAGVYWGHHAHDSKPLCPESIKLCNKLLDPSGLRWLSYSEVVGGNANLSFKRFISTFRNSYPSPLFYASLWGITETMHFLIDRGEDMNHVGGLYGSPLSAAAAHGHQDAVSLLIKKGANVNIVGGKYGTAIQTAAAQGKAKILENLLENKAEVNLVGGWSHTSALVLASKISNKKTSESVIRMLVDAGADLNATDPEGVTALHAAALNGSINVLKLLIDKNAKLDMQDVEGSTPLLLAMLQSRHTAAKCLIESGADLNVKNKYGEAPIHVAISQAQHTLLKTLLYHKVDVNLGNSEGRTALHYAVDDNDGPAAELLVAHNANVNAPDEDGCTPLHLAKLNSEQGALSTLIMDKAATILQEALMEWKIDDNEALSGQVAQESVLTEEAQLSLQMAVISGHKKAAEFLIEKGALVDAKDASGYTPLHEAVMNGDFAKALLLLEHGADLEAEDNHGRTPLRLFLEFSNDEGDEIVKLLRIYEQKKAAPKAI